MSGRFAKSDWLGLGFQSLKQEGPSGLTIDALCQACGKTRGSFYFHFAGIDTFLTELTEQWHAAFTTAIVDTPPPETSRTDLLNQLAGRLDLSLESGIRQLAQVNRQVGEIVREADKTRENWLAERYAASNRYDRTEAQNLAKIEYAAFVGFRLIDPDLSARQARDLYDAFLAFTDRT